MVSTTQNAALLALDTTFIHLFLTWYILSSLSSAFVC